MGGQYNPPPINESMRSILGAVTDLAPGTLTKLNAATQALAPSNAALDYNQYLQYAPKYLTAGENLADEQASRATARDLAVINSGGGQLAQKALELDRLANPEFYANRAAAGQGFQALLAGQDPNNLTGSEMANVERGINRLNMSRGTPSNIGDATTTASNAMLFGDKLNQKRAAFGQSLAMFPGIQQGSQSGINAYQIAAGRGAASGTNASLGQYRGPQQFDANAQIQSMNQGALSMEQNRQNIMSQKKTGLDMATQAMSGIGSMCCFIFLEAYNGQLPESVRLCRDVHYQRHPQLSVGYKRTARWLVPMMRKSRVVTWLVNLTMVKPITRYGEWLVGNQETVRSSDRLIRNSWFKFWNWYGKA